MIITNRLTIDNYSSNESCCFPKIKGPSFQTLSRKSKIVIEKCESVWSYLGKTMVFTRHVLNVVLKNSYRFTVGCKNFDNRITSAIAHLKVFSIVGVPFSLMAIPNTAQKIFKNIQSNDKEGAALTSLSLVVITADIMDSMSTIINASLTLASKVPLEILSTIGLPLAFTVVGLGSLLRSVQLAKTYLFYRNLKKEVFSNIDPTSLNHKEVEDLLWKYLNKNLGNDEQTPSLKNLKKAKLLREAPAVAVEKFEEIIDLLKKYQELNVEQIENILETLDQIDLKFKQKMSIEIGNLIANALTFIGLCLFFAVVPAGLSFIFFAVAVVIRIALLAYQNAVA